MLSYNRSMYIDTDVFNACKNTEKQNYFEDLEKKIFIKCFHRGLRKKKKEIILAKLFFPTSSKHRKENGDLENASPGKKKILLLPLRASLLPHSSV